MVSSDISIKKGGTIMEFDIILTSLLFSVVFFSVVGGIIVQTVRWLRDYSSSMYIRRIMKDYYQELKELK